MAGPHAPSLSMDGCGALLRLQRPTEQHCGERYIGKITINNEKYFCEFKIDVTLFF